MNASSLPLLTRRTVPLLLTALLAACSGSGGNGDDGGSSSNTPRQGTLLNGSSCSLKYYAQAAASQGSGNDPLFPSQWYLQNTGSLTGYSGMRAAEDLDMTQVWNSLGARGEGIRVAVVDDGLEVTHDDLAPNVVEGASYNYISDGSWKRGSPWPMPCDAGQSHGTNVAGVIGARDSNGIGVRGVAPRTSLVGYNALQTGNSADALDAMVRDQDKNHIYNNSWGASDDGLFNAPTDGATHAKTIRNGLDNGRNKLGSIFTFAAGNGAEYGDYSVLDGNASVLGALPVCATDASGKRAAYSEPGPNLLVCAPSSGTGQKTASNLPSVSTTGLQNAYSDEFSGTSAATPMISGVVALMLQANPNLSWRDVRLILAKTARQVNSSSAGWTSYEGYHFNHEYGFGVADAAAAVAQARTWQSVGGSQTMKQCGPYNVTANTGIPEVNPVTDSQLANPFQNPASLNQPVTDGITSSVSPSTCTLNHIEHIDVTVTATNAAGTGDHPNPGDLQMTLTSPSGQTSTLTVPHQCYYVTNSTRTPVNACSGLKNFTFGLSRHMEEPVVATSGSSTWTLGVADRRAGNTGRLGNWSITFYGR